MATATTLLDRQTLQACKDDPVVFGRVLAGRELFPHQADVARSNARIRTICSGRQAGKSALLSVLGLHRAYRQPGALVLIVSAGEDAAARLLQDMASLVTSPLLKGSVVDENKSLITLSNGSVLRSVPASVKQIRGWPVDLLIMDEAGFLDNEIWEAAEPTIIARPGSQIIMSSSPWGGAEDFFRVLWHRAMRAPDERVEAWHWPSSISPLVDQAYLADVAERAPAGVFRREYLAEWQDDAGAYFTQSELDEAVADTQLLDPAAVLRETPWDRWAESYDRQFACAMGVDWGMARDAQATVLMAALNDGGMNDGTVFYIPWLEARFRCSYADWIDYLVTVARSYRVIVAASETNGVGAYPTAELGARMLAAGTGTAVCPVVTDARRKASGFGMIKTLLQRGRLLLPRHPEFLKQLAGLEFEQLPGGQMRIAVPERSGHDDLAMAALQAVTALNPAAGPMVRDSFFAASDIPHTVSPKGIRVPDVARPRPDYAPFHPPSGREKGFDPGW